MKNILRHISLLFIGIVTVSAAYAFSPRLDGTMMPYDFAQTDSVVPWGADKHPVFVNYVARHGARFLSSPKKTESLVKHLEKARQEGRLTDKGADFLRLLNKVDSVSQGRWGALSPLGIDEEQRLGSQLAAIVPDLMKSGRVEAVSSYVPRVVMTMYEFCHSLSEHFSDLEVITAEGKNFNPLLRFFTTDTQYVDYISQGPWRYAYENYSESTLPVAPAASMINAVSDSHQLQKLSLDAYDVLQGMAASGIEADPSEWFTEEEYAACWKVDNLKHYYQRSASTFSPLPARSATPLLQRMLDNAQKSFDNENGQLKADLMFGHAETVIPLFTLMRLPGCYSPDCLPDQVAGNWKDWEVSPLGANLMMVCLKGDDGTDYISLRLNGRWIEIEGSKVIEWKAFKDHMSFNM